MNESNTITQVKDKLLIIDLTWTCSLLKRKKYGPVAITHRHTDEHTRIDEHMRR